MSPQAWAKGGQGMENMITMCSWKERKGKHYSHRKRREVEVFAEEHLSPPPLVTFAVAVPAVHESRRMEYIVGRVNRNVNRGKHSPAAVLVGVEPVVLAHG